MAYVNPVTDADCEAFDGYVLKWQRLLNLSDWRIERAAKRSKRNMAEVSINAGARLAVYRIGVSFGQPVTPELLEATALHELLHIFLFDAINEPSEGNEHRPINVLEKLLMERK